MFSNKNNLIDVKFRLIKTKICKFELKEGHKWSAASQGNKEMLQSYSVSDNGTMSAVVSPESNGYDGTGAMWFVILVIFVYGFAVVGVFLFNFYKRSSNNNDELDRQAITYFKNIDLVRKSMEKRNRLDCAQNLMKNIPSNIDFREGKILQNGLTYLALPDMSKSGEGCDQHFNSKDICTTESSDTTTWSEYTVDDIMEELTDESSEPDVSNA